MKQCSICGRKTNRTYNLYGYKTVCSKHMHQILKYGKPLDNIPRTVNDLNDYTTDGITATFNIYSQTGRKISEFIIDFEDLEKVKYHKWRLGHNHVLTGSADKVRDLSYIVLGIEPNKDIVVDHIDGNPFNNRKNNLRICSQKENILNKSFMSTNTSGFIGVSYKKDRNYYDPEIRFQSKRCHLGACKSLEDAVYKRYYAERLLFKEFANEQEQKKKINFCKNISEERKRELEQIVIEKLKSRQLVMEKFPT